MLRVDIGGYKLSSANYKRNVFGDGECESHMLAKFVGLLKLSNHIVSLRHNDWNVQNRAEFLLHGYASDVSLSLRTHQEPVQGWAIRLPEHATEQELILQRCLRNHLKRLLPATLEEIVLPGRGILLPHREHDRPARIELSLVSTAADELHVRTHVVLQQFAKAFSIAMSEYDANYNTLFVTKPEPVIKTATLAEIESPARRKRRER